MSWLRKISIVACLVAIASCSGCCAFRSCAGGGLGCGLESYYQGGCTDGGCDGCGDGPVIPCRAGATPGGCGLGLGCIGRLLGMVNAGCNGCGETYYHGWVNDPPCCDPCDSCGNWTGAASPSCGCGEVGCNSCNSGGDCAAAPSYVEPSCGLAVDCDPCGGCRRSAFQMPGRALYATWTGFGGLCRGFRCGFLPSCRTCNAFSISSSCNSCATGPACGVVGDPSCGCGGGTDVYFGGAGGRCSSCAQHSVATQPILARHRSDQSPHGVVSHQVKVAHGRRPHKIVTSRLRQQR